MRHVRIELTCPQCFAKRCRRESRMLRYGGPQDRVTDHRIVKSWGNIAGIMDGNLEKIISTPDKTP